MAKKSRNRGTRKADKKVGAVTPAVIRVEQSDSQEATQDGANAVNKNRSYEEVRPKG